MRALLALAAVVLTACPAASPTGLVLADDGPGALVVVKVGDAVTATPPPVGGTDENWSFRVDEKPAGSGLAGPLFGSKTWSFSVDAAGAYRICAAHGTRTACGQVSAVERLVVKAASVHVERERAVLAGSFALPGDANEPVGFRFKDGVVAVGSGSTAGGVTVDDERVEGPVASDALGPLVCRLLGAPGPLAVCPSPAGAVPPLGDHLRWQGGVIGDVTGDDGTVTVDADVVPAAPTAGPALTALTLDASGVHFTGTIAPAAAGTVTLEMRSDDAGFPGGFARVEEDAAGGVEGDLAGLGGTAPAAAPGSYDVVTRVTSAGGEGIATFPITLP